MGGGPILSGLLWLLAAVWDCTYDAAFLLFSMGWPVIEGEVTAVDIERIEQHSWPDSFQLAVAYKFSIGADGPYTGESFWKPLFFSHRRVAAARRKIRNHQRVLVRYRMRDPSANALDRRIWQSCKLPWWRPMARAYWE